MDITSLITLDHRYVYDLNFIVCHGSINFFVIFGGKFVFIVLNYIR